MKGGGVDEERRIVNVRLGGDSWTGKDSPLTSWPRAALANDVTKRGLCVSLFLLFTHFTD
jgi:hypothetical protein